MDDKRKKFITAFVIMSFVFVMLTYASVNSVKTVDNSFSPADVNVAVVENGSRVSGQATVPFTADSDGGSVYTADKKIQIENIGGANPAPVYVRVCIFPKFDCDTNTALQVGILSTFPTAVTNNTLVWNDVTLQLVDGWEKNWQYDGTSGYFYYISDKLYTTGKDEDGNETTLETPISKGLLPSGFTTAPLLKSVSVDSNIIVDNYQSKGASLKVVVLADSIQTVGNAVEQRWGTNVGLTSDDKERPSSSPSSSSDSSSSDSGETVSVKAARDVTTSGSAVERPYFVTLYEKARVQNMITSVTATVTYALPEDDTDTAEAEYYEEENEYINEEENVEENVEVEAESDTDTLSDED